MLKRALPVLVVLGVGLLLWLVAGGHDPAMREPVEPTTSEPATTPDRERTRTPREAAAENTPERADDAPDDPESPAPPSLRVVVESAATSQPLADARVVIALRGGGRLEARTDANGVAVVFPAPADGGQVSAFAPGHARDFSSFQAAPDRAEADAFEVRLRLRPAVALVGRVLDPDGRPLEGVRVDLEEGGSLGGVSSSSAGPLLGTATSKIDGTFTIDGALADDLITLLIVHPGFAAFERTVRLVPDGGSPAVEVRLARGGRITGVVRGPDDAPVPGATVLAAAADSEHLLDDPDASVIAAGSSQIRVLSGVTDEQGRYRVDGLTLDAPYSVVATRRGVGRSERQPNVVARSDAAPPSLDLRLRAHLELTIRVVDEAGDRITGARVLCLTGRFQQVREREDGRYRIGSLAPGEVVCDVDADGFVKRRITHELATTGELVVRLERGLRISGVAVDDRGKPLAGARIRCMRPLGAAFEDLPDSLADGKTDADGRFSVGGLLPGAHAVLCWADGHGRGKLEPVEAGAQDVRVVAPREATVTLLLELPPGASPPPKLTRQIRREGGGTGREMDWPEDGRLEVAIPPIPATLVIQVEGYADVPFEVELGAGEVRDLGTVRLGKGRTATGRVTDPSGGAVPGASITVRPPWSFDGRTSRTDASGAFAADRLPPTRLEVEISAPGFLPTVVDRDGGGDLAWNFTLERGGLVSGVVRTADGVGVADGTVWLVALDGSEEERDDRTDLAYPENAGSYGLRVRPGRYRVEYRPEDGEPVVIRTVNLAEGAGETVDIVVED